MTEHREHVEAERDRYKAALERILEKRRREEEFWHPGVQFPTEHAKDWHDGYVTALATVSLIAREALDPEAWAEDEEDQRIASHGSDREWFERTGMCGHCGNVPEDCQCTPNDPCGCGPHELRTEPTPCWRCGGTGEVAPVRRVVGVVSEATGEGGDG